MTGAGEVAVQRRFGDADLGGDLAEAVSSAVEQPRIFDLFGGVRDGTPDVATSSLGHGAGMRGAFGSVGAFHLGEQRQQQERKPAHPFLGGVDRQRVCQRTHADALTRELVDKVEHFAQVAPEPAEGVHDDRVAFAGISQQRGQPAPIDAGAGLVVAVDPLFGVADPGQGIELALQ